MMQMSNDQALKALRGKHRIRVLQPDKRGVVREMIDAKSGKEYFLKAQKIRKALSGKQNLMMCTAGNQSNGNAFFIAIDEVVALDRFNGDYVIMSPMVHVPDITYGRAYFSPNDR